MFLIIHIYNDNIILSAGLVIERATQTQTHILSHTHIYTHTNN